MSGPWSRRDFLRASAAAVGGLGWRSASSVIDTHMHVWSADVASYPFAHPYSGDFSAPALAGTVERLVEEMDAYGITHAILVQMIYYGWDNRYTVDCLHRYPDRFRAQGLIDPTDPNRADRLEYWMRQGLSGMRFSPLYYRDSDEWMNDRDGYALWERAESLGAVFNFFITTPQLPRLEEMVARFPGVKVVIDHLARVDLSGPDPEGEFTKLTRLARYPNVWAKVSELELISATREFPFRDTFPYVRRMYDSFGPERLLWGTGFPGATRAQAGRIPLEQEMQLIREEIPLFTEAERERIMGLNALEVWDFERQPRRLGV
ncbi:MAG TPA: amidohydrolase family protein [Longimicrobiaceae bacterium]|nr:amidohydrolase family protein [Longimicrobiaceae bacterium]